MLKEVESPSIHPLDDASRPLLSDHGRQRDEQEKSRTFLQHLHHHYHVSQEMILRKLFQISPWKWMTMRQYSPLFYRTVEEEKAEEGNGQRRLWSWLSVSLLFPFKLLCHLLLIVFLALILSYNNDLYASYHRAAQSISCRFFLPTDYCNYEDCVGSLSRNSPSVNSFTCSIYQRDVMTDVLLRSIEEYFYINE